MSEIKEEPKYKVGDIVTIKDFGPDISGYRFGINEKMIALSGQSLKIREVAPATGCAERLPDDGYSYRLEGNSWSWASSMFIEKVSASSVLTVESVDNNIDAFINKNKRPELDFKL